MWSTSRGHGSTDSHSHGDVEDRMSGGRRNGKRRSNESTGSRSSSSRRCSRREECESDEDDDLESSASAEHEGQQTSGAGFGKKVLFTAALALLAILVVLFSVFCSMSRGIGLRGTASSSPQRQEEMITQARAPAPPGAVRSYGEPSRSTTHNQPAPTVQVDRPVQPVMSHQRDENYFGVKTFLLGLVFLFLFVPFGFIYCCAAACAPKTVAIDRTKA